MKISLWVMGASLCCAAAWAAPTSSDSTSSGSTWPAAGKSEDPALKAAKASIAAGDFSTAQTGLKQALAADPGNADLHNMYAYSIRKGANPDMQVVFQHYSEALRIDPKHRGAQEYIGEAYLMVGNLAKAKEHLAALDKLCFFGCEEYDMLKKAVVAYEAKPK